MFHRIFSEIEYGSDAYKQCLALRDAVLRKPLGLNFSKEFLERERDHHHLVCQEDGKVVGCLVLVPLGGDEVRMRQVAIAPEFQKQGIGRALAQFAEGFAREHGYTMVTLHARDTAVAFYEKLGYECVGEPFEQVTILHWEMRKRLS